MKKQIREFMTHFPLTIDHDQSLKVACEMLIRFNIRHLPVRKAGKLIGIVSERDIQMAHAFEGTLTSVLKVEDIMIPDPYCVSPDSSLKEVMNIMAQEKLSSVLITEKDDLVGIFTSIDVCQLASKLLHQQEELHFNFTGNLY